MTKTNKILTAALLITSAITLGTVGISAIPTNITKIGNAITQYNCNEIVFGTDIGSTAETNKTKFKCESKTIDFEFGTVSNSGWNSYQTGAVRVGGSSNAGQLTFTLADGLECSRVIVYATTWSGETAAALDVNDVGYQTVSTTIDDNYDFSNSYVYEFERTSTIKLDNKQSTGRCLISKIVLRTY